MTQPKVVMELCRAIGSMCNGQHKNNQDRFTDDNTCEGAS